MKKYKKNTKAAKKKYLPIYYGGGNLENNQVDPNIPVEGVQSVNPNIAPMAAGAGILGDGLESIDSNTGAGATKWGQAGAGALKGAAIGTVLLPGIGTAVGGAIGGAAGFFKGRKAEEGREEQKVFEEAQQHQARISNRLQEESFKPAMTFEDGGAITTQRGVSAPNYRNITPTTFNQQLLRKGMISPGYDTLATSAINQQIMDNYKIKEGFAAPYRALDTGKGRVYQKDYGRSTGEYYDPSGSGEVVDKYNKSRVDYTNGGRLEGTENNKDVTYFGNGGSHQENQNGGIPLGNKGKVEEGEVRWKDYIFSNRF